MKPRYRMLLNVATDTASGAPGSGGASPAAPATSQPAAAPAPGSQGGAPARTAADFMGFSTPPPAGATPAQKAPEQGGGKAPEKAPETKPAPSPQKGFMEALEEGLEQTRKAKEAAAKPGAQEQPGKADDAAGKGGQQAKETPAAATDKAPEQKPAFDLQAWLAERVPESPTGIAKVEDWKAQRGLLSKALADLQEMGLENALLKQNGATVAKPDENGKVTMPETDAVKALQLELQQLKDGTDKDFQAWREEKARADLDNNQAFRAEFDGKRAGLVDEMKSIASEAGIEESVIEALTEAGSDYKIGKALEDVDDKTAKRLLTERARAFNDLTKAKDAARAKPLDEVTKWKDFSDNLQGVIGTQVAQKLQGAYLNAAKEIVGKLTGNQGDIFFKTPGGRLSLEQLNARFTRGVDVSPAEVFEALAHKDAFATYRGLAEKQAKQIVALNQELARYAAAAPEKTAAQAAAGGAGGGGAKTGGFDPSKMFG